MATATFTNLFSSPFKITRLPVETLHSPQTRCPNVSQATIDSSRASTFPIAHLPYELRQIIYDNYHHSLHSIQITKRNASLPIHALTPLALSSPFFTRELPTFRHFSTTTFIFTHGSDLQIFAANPVHRAQVRKVRILLGSDASRDWVFLLLSSFEGLEEVTFEVPSGHGKIFGAQWGLLRDAVREGLCSRVVGDDWGGLILKVLDGEWAVEERFG